VNLRIVMKANMIGGFSIEGHRKYLSAVRLRILSRCRMDIDAMFGCMNQQLGIAVMLYVGNREYPVGSLILGKWWYSD
jgi:hypothetical protein